MADAGLDLDDVFTKHVRKPSQAANPELALLYSRPGGGKTWLAASISEVPGVSKVLILDTEGSTVGAIAEFDDDKVDIIDCRRDTPEESFKFLNTVLDALFDTNNKHSYDAVIVDVFDVAQDWCVAYWKANPPLNDRGKVDGFALWGNVKEWSVRVATNLKRIKPYGVLVVHDREEKDDDGSVQTKLNLVGSAKDVLPGIPDMVVYLQRKLEDGEEVTYGYFATEDNKVTKNRFGFPPAVKNPTFPKLFKFIADKQEKKA